MFIKCVCLAAAKLDRKEAAILVQKLYAKYENHLKDPPQGLVYGQVYNLKTGKITNRDYIELLHEVQRELKDIGLDVCPYYAKQ